MPVSELLLYRLTVTTLSLAFFAVTLSSSAAEKSTAPTPPDPLPEHAITFLKAHCLKCHSGKKPKAKLDLSQFQTITSLGIAPSVWEEVLTRVTEEEMPPEDEDPVPAEERARFIDWIASWLGEAACEDGISPGPAMVRRLNRNEYAATIRDVLRVHFNAADALPTDGAGGEGFDNTTETLFISPVHLEKYLDAAEQALDYAVKDPQAREKLLVAKPSDETSSESAARLVLKRFLPLAFRRPTREGELDSYLQLFQKATERGESYERAITFALRGVLLSPYFLLLIEEPVKRPEPQLLDHYELASRLSYFLWGSMPDEELFDLASKGQLHETDTLDQQVIRMLKHRSARGFTESFVEQWLGTRELGRGIKPDRSLSRRYNDNLEAVIKYEPILFFEEILAENHSLLKILSADFSYMNNRLARHYGLPTEGLREHPKRVELPQESHRGGVLGMAAVLAVSSYPHRTSPVLRGKWVLESLLGAPPPPPPPDVPELEEPGKDATPATLRERLMQHRAKPVCASCHDRIDPIGFGLENYDVLGRWRTEDAGQTIDSQGQLLDGTTFNGPEELKTVLLDRKHQFIRHLTTKMLGYALARGLTLEDYCTIDSITKELEKNEYSAHTLVLEIVRSVPFRYKAGVSSAAVKHP